jgi:hypothetical protein
MRIDLDEIEECSKCGCLFNFILATRKLDHESDYQRSPIHRGKCPACKEEFAVFE